MYGVSFALLAGFLAAVGVFNAGCTSGTATAELVTSAPTTPVATAMVPQWEPAHATRQAAATLAAAAQPAAVPPATAPLTPTAVVSDVAIGTATPTPTAEVAPPETETSTLYTVQAGDTLLGIAMTFDVPMAALQLANDLGMATLIYLDQVLEIPAAQAWTETSPFWVVYEVEAGETLGQIAVSNGLSLDELLAANADVDADQLSIGQPLVLPLPGPQEMLAQASVSETSPEPLAATPEPAATTETELVAEVPVDASAAEPITEPTTDVAPLPSTDASTLPVQIFQLINAERAAYGLPPLAWNDTLARAAQRHADDCYARGWCGHAGSDGSTYKQRIIREGYDPVRWSECWAWYESAERAVAMWMDEVPPNDPHRSTILNAALTEVGVGVVPGNGYGYYFIADFGAPR